MSDGETPRSGKADKRARKKAHRDEQLAAYWASVRRRRNMRLVVGAALLAALVVAAFVWSDDGQKGDKQSPAGRPTPSPSPAAAYPPGSIPPVTDELTPDCPRDGEPPVQPTQKQYDEAPAMALKKTTDYAAVVTTSCGEIEIDLAEGTAPTNVNNFVFLARDNFFDGLVWHRVERNAVVQTGDPNGVNGTPPDGPGYAVSDELPDARKDYVYGVVGMANSGPNTAGSQWFVVTHKPGPAGYEPLYTIIGKVERKSYTVLDSIDKQPTRGGSDPVAAVLPVVPIYIVDIEIVER